MDEEKEEKGSTISSDLIRGHINTIILRTLYDRDKYGYEIIEEIEANSHGQYTLKQPTLYSALKRLESQGYINAYWKTDEVSLGGRRKYYTLTDSGREITEKNQAEWEYSRTIIDSLISDRSFDFSNPAPTPVDFNILKQTTSRVPVIKSEDEEKTEERDGQAAETVVSETATEEKDVNTTEGESSVTTLSSEQTVSEETAVVTETAEFSDTTEEQKRIQHENYLKLISEPVPPPVRETESMPSADEIDTQRLIYNNKPETERDYRNLVNNLFVRTVDRVPSSPKQNPAVQTQPVTSAEAPKTATVRVSGASVASNSDGFSVNTNDYAVTGTRRNRYNRGNALFISSLIVGAVMLFITIMSAAFTKQLKVNWTYPVVIAAIAVTQCLIFFVLRYTDIGKNNRRPVNNSYLAACIVVTAVAILVIVIVSVLITNFNSAGEVMAKLVIPSFVALNITVFGVTFYLLSK